MYREVESHNAIALSSRHVNGVNLPVDSVINDIVINGAYKVPKLVVLQRDLDWVEGSLVVDEGLTLPKSEIISALQRIMGIDIFEGYEKKLCVQCYIHGHSGRR